jgi:hypothetical protein
VRPVMSRAALCAALLLGPAARAAEPAPAGVAPPADAETPKARPYERGAPGVPAGAQRNYYYGWQILLADLAVIGCGISTYQDWCLAGYFVAGPVVHGFHGSPGRAGLSLALRITLPILGGLVGNASATCPSEDDSGEWFCGLEETLIGVLTGAGAAAVVDYATAFSDSAPEPARESRRTSWFSIAPRLAVGQSNVAMGIGGAF